MNLACYGVSKRIWVLNGECAHCRSIILTLSTTRNLYSVPLVAHAINPPWH